MKSCAIALLRCSVILVLVSAFLRTVSAAPANVFVVAGDPSVCPEAQFTKIQAAVDAASPGQRIHICKAVYAEQVKITKPLRISAESGAVVMPSAMQQNTTSLVTGKAIAAAILVVDTTNVEIEGLIVDGANNGISACSPQLIGVEFQNASGEVETLTIRNFKLSPSLNGCQSGTAMFVQSGGGGLSDVEINNSVIYDYQKNGITADEVGTKVLIHENIVTGVGPTTGAAQNGIQIGFGASGAIRGNTVTNNVWSPCTAVATCTNVATGILVEQSDSVHVAENHVGVTQVGIFVHANDASLRANQVSSASVFDGIRMEGNGNRAHFNSIFAGPEAGLFLQGNNNVIRQNKIVAASVGILKDTGSTGNLIAGNQILDSLVTIQDPQMESLANKIIPDR